jgi:asparagine synthase (glutamine-hydrolysing)
MCGIIGIVGRNAPVPAEVLEHATASLTHRGPDDGGTVILRDHSPAQVEIGLGNRRLAILDLSPLGHQPMHDPATGNWIVYNGEIYNFREVRRTLEHDGFQFVSHSDTEVILKAYAHWGEDCLTQFRGMFAFAIWDAKRHRLFLVRDPMGIKPLYFYQSENYFLFSSEVRTLLGTGLVPRKIDPAGLVNYLTFGSVYEPHTLIERVRSLAPGHWLAWADGKITQTRYWDLLDPRACNGNGNGKAFSVHHASRAKLEAEVAEQLDECVRLQLVSDVPVGVFLSGGIDSSALVGVLHRSGVRPSTFSIVFREAGYSEAAYSRAVAEHFHTDHHEITVSQSDLFAAVDPALSSPALTAMDQPTIDGINTYFVSQQARAAGVKVALSGLGGDELFAGYAGFRSVPRMERFANSFALLPENLRSLVSQLFVKFAPSNDKNRKLATFLRNGSGAVSAYFLSRMLFAPDLRERLLLERQDASDLPREEKLLADTLNRAQHLDPVNRVSYLETRCYMLNTLLRDSDFMSMAHGLEVRVPLIDHQLACRVLALPGEWKLDSATPKPLLVRALNGRLPAEIVHRRKRGFTLPFEHWLRDALRPVIETSLAQIQDGVLGQWIDRQAAVRIWQDFLEYRTSWSRPWSLYVLQRWSKQHLS